MLLKYTAKEARTIIRREGGTLSIGALLRGSVLERLKHFDKSYAPTSTCTSAFVWMFSQLQVSNRASFDQKLTQIAARQPPFQVVVNYPFVRRSNINKSINLSLASEELMEIQAELSYDFRNHVRLIDKDEWYPSKKFRPNISMVQGLTVDEAERTCKGMKDELGDEIDLLATGLFLRHQEVYQKVPIKTALMENGLWPTDKFYPFTGPQ